MRIVIVPDVQVKVFSHRKAKRKFGPKRQRVVALKWVKTVSDTEAFYDASTDTCYVNRRMYEELRQAEEDRVMREMGFVRRPMRAEDGKPEDYEPLRYVTVPEQGAIS